MLRILKGFGPTDVVDSPSQESNNDRTRTEQLIQYDDANAVPMNAIARASADQPIHQESTQVFNNDFCLSVVTFFVSARKTHALNKLLKDDESIVDFNVKKLNRREKRQIDKTIFIAIILKFS